MSTCKKKCCGLKLCEECFEPHVENYIHRKFVFDQFPSPRVTCNWFFVNTASMRQPEGSWSLPDILLILVSGSALQPMPKLSLVGFELKVAGNFNTHAVLQAYNQSRFINSNYLVSFGPREAAKNTIIKDARENGLGVIWARDPCQLDTYDVVVAANHRPSPQSEDFEKLLRHVLNSHQIGRLQQWLQPLTTPGQFR